MNARVLLTGTLVALPLLAFLGSGLGRDPRAIASPLIGRPAPPFTLTPAGGGAPVSLASLRGRPVVVNFWASWCVPCAQEHPHLRSAAAALGDVRVLGIAYEDDEAGVRDFVARHGGGFPSLMDVDGRTAVAYGVLGVPETYFIDARGTVVAKYAGPLTRDLLIENLRKAGASVRVATGTAR